MNLLVSTGSDIFWARLFLVFLAEYWSKDFLAQETLKTVFFSPQKISDPVLTNRFTSYPMMISSTLDKEKQVRIMFSENKTKSLNMYLACFDLIDKKSLNIILTGME